MFFVVILVMVCGYFSWAQLFAAEKKAVDFHSKGCGFRSSTNTFSTSLVFRCFRIPGGRGAITQTPTLKPQIP